MTLNEKIYGRFVIDFFDDGEAMGIKDYAHIDPDTPKAQQQALSKIFNCLHKNYPMLIIAETEQMQKDKKQ